MSKVYTVPHLPEVDQRMLKRGLCPWCVVRLVENDKGDECPACGDEFHGALTIED